MEIVASTGLCSVAGGGNFEILLGFDRKGGRMMKDFRASHFFASLREGLPWGSRRVGFFRQREASLSDRSTLAR